MRYLSDRKGFTLVELMAVLVIIAMAAGVVSISIGRSRDKARVRDEASRLWRVLRHARQLSLMERVPVEFRYDGESRQFEVIKTGNRIVGSGNLDPLLEVTADNIVFFPKGNSTGGSITITSPEGRIYTIEVDSVTGQALIGRI